MAQAPSTWQLQIKLRKGVFQNFGPPHGSQDAAELCADRLHKADGGRRLYLLRRPGDYRTQLPVKV